MSKEKRTATLTTRLSEREARVVEELAKREDISVSRLIRERLFPSGSLEDRKLTCD